MSKPFWMSKTLWWNIITLALELGKAFTDVGLVPSHVLVLINAFGNVLLRFLTSTSVTITPPRG